LFADVVQDDKGISYLHTAGDGQAFSCPSLAVKSKSGNVMFIYASCQAIVTGMLVAGSVDLPVTRYLRMLCKMIMVSAIYLLQVTGKPSHARHLP